jgi:hypothetical protein
MHKVLVMKRSALVLGFSVAACALAFIGEREAAACGGCFHPPTQVASDITDERMLLSVSPQQTTLYDQIRYSGSPTSFAWVLPIHGTVDVGLSADVLFGAVDTLTSTTINPPPSSCPAAPNNCQSQGFGASTNAAAPSSDASGGGVTVTKQQNVGPYSTVQLHATDSSALENWLAQNGFDIPADVKPVITQYVTEGFDFLAMKLLPGAGVQSMRPVRVTSPGASLSLPLRMAAIGTGVSVGITLWVVSDGRYEPQNFPFYHIEDKDLIWDWSTSASNYTTLRAQNESTLNGKGWEIESSLTLNQGLISNVINSGGVYYGGGGVSQSPPSQASDDYLAVPGDDDAGTGGGGKTADQVRTEDIAALFAGMAVPNVRITRMRSDIAHAAMTQDFVLTASKDQSELTNVRTLTQSVNEQCTVYQGCNAVGQGTPAEAEAAQNGGGKESFTCAATARGVSTNHLGGIALASAGGLGLVAMRLIRRRRQQKKAKQA